MPELSEFCVKGRAMNMNHLPLMKDTSEDNNPMRHPQDDNSQQHLTLSQIAARLHLISDQMKGKKPLKTTQDIPLFAQKTEEGIKGYLDDIARAVLAEYNARRNSHNELLAYLERIEHFLETMQKNNNETVLFDRQALRRDTAEEFGGRLRQELEAQTKEFVAENQKSNQEISRQLREAIATSRFSVQLMSLQKQITNIQAKLDTFNDVGKKSLFENKTQAVTPQTFLPAASVTAAALADNQANTNVRNFDESVIRKLAAGKMGESRFAPADKFQSTDQEQLSKKTERLDDDKTNGDKHVSQTAAQNIVGARAAEQTVRPAKSQKLCFRFELRKIFTRIAALF